jgi:hypothetical protein
MSVMRVIRRVAWTNRSDGSRGVRAGLPLWLLAVLLAVAGMPAPTAAAQDVADDIDLDDDAPEVAAPAPTATPTATQPASRPAATRPSTRPNRNPPDAVDALDHVDTADAWSAGTLQNANVLPDYPPRVAMGYKEGDYPRIGTWTGPETRAKFAFTSLVATFNQHTPPKTGATLEVRVRHGGDAWSPWLYLQSWGTTVVPPQRTTSFERGAVDIDELVLTEPADAYQARVTLTSFAFDGATAPAVRRVSVCYSGVVADAERRAKLAPKPSKLPADWAADLKVPFRGQGAADVPKAIRGMVCSPTSTSMVMEYFGATFTTVENAEAIYDPHWDLFGNWGRAVSRAGELGLDAWLARFRSWDGVKAEVARGNPVVASIRFRKGEVKGFLYESTRGHLLVVRGFTPTGDVIVNDPARKEKGHGVVYPAAEFAKAWFDNGGVGYVIRKPDRPVPASLVTMRPAATAPGTRSAAEPGDAPPASSAQSR